mmetsp:Transcript_6896/g.10092  ORF Transcript_6896/g.10092 Transcript_6896/m.10092 type:complete len:276 (+) Transcript_6896:51-878(+)
MKNMTYIALYAILISIVLVAKVMGDEDPCHVNFPSGNWVDLNQLKQATYFKATSGGSGGLTYYVNICTPAKYSCDGKEYPSSVDVGFNCLAASSNNVADISTEVIGEKDDIPSLYLNYKGGAKDGSMHTLSTQIKITCDPNPDAKDAFSFVSDTDVSSTERQFSFALTSHNACYAPSGCGGFFGCVMGVGGIIIILLIVGIIAYIVIGIIVQVVRVKKYGATLESPLEYIPNWNFWKVLPGLFKDGVLLVVDGIKALVNKIKKGKGGSSESYDSV